MRSTCLSVTERDARNDAAVGYVRGMLHVFAVSLVIGVPVYLVYLVYGSSDLVVVSVDRTRSPHTTTTYLLGSSLSLPFL